MRRTFGRVIQELADECPALLVLYADTAWPGTVEMEQRFPERCINIGIAEAAMIGISAGMALEGLQPVVYGMTPFITERCCEQLKLDIAQQGAKVLLCAWDNYPKEVTQRPMNVPVLMSLFPAITAYFPKNGAEASAMLREAHKNRPSFVWLTKDPDA